MGSVISLGPNRLHLAGMTDTGQVRKLNEDNMLVSDSLPLCAVADGMGGHAAGEVASQIAVQTIERHFEGAEEDAPPTWPYRPQFVDLIASRMAVAVKLANSRIFEESSADSAKKGMGCTVDAAFFSRGRCYIGHVGDSRAYRYRKGRLDQLTSDHSLLNDYRQARDMSKDEIDAFPHKNVVVRALGLAERVKVDILVDVYEDGDIYLLCSDGLTDMLDDQAVAKLIKRNGSDLDAMASQLVGAANEAGGKDNISAVLARVEFA